MTNPFNTPRARVWRYLMIAAINEGLGLGRFTLDPQPGDDQHEIESWSFFAPGYAFGATASHIGHGEIAVQVTFNRASPPIARGWLERKTDRYLQVAPGKVGHLYRLARPIHDAFKDHSITPAGYGDQGRFYA